MEFRVLLIIWRRCWCLVDNEKEKYMKRALELAALGTGHTSPNPLVGCVVVKQGRIIGEGYHQKCGEYHAERNALLNCKEDTEGAELYVTLEPCCHYGKTPPCTEIIIEKGIKKVYIGSGDPNPLVAGKGSSILREHGIEVEEYIMEDECLKLNEIFFHYIREKVPFIAMKYAMTLDGKIAAFTGDSKWVTGEEARKHVHFLRKKYSGIMAGIGTVLADDPMLNCRIEDGVDPMRIICDTYLRLPLSGNIAKTSENIPTIVACGENADVEREKELTAKGIKIVRIPEISEGILNLRYLMKYLGSEIKLDSILLEGGGNLNASALEQGIVNKVYAYIAPKIIGGADAKSPIEGSGISFMKDAVMLQDTEITKLGNDYCISGGVKCLPE